MEVPCAKMGDMAVVNIPVQMLAVTDRNGKLTPLWFRFETEEHQIEKVGAEIRSLFEWGRGKLVDKSKN